MLKRRDFLKWAAGALATVAGFFSFGLGSSSAGGGANQPRWVEWPPWFKWGETRAVRLDETGTVEVLCTDYPEPTPQQQRDAEVCTFAELPARAIRIGDPNAQVEVLVGQPIDAEAWLRMVEKTLGPARLERRWFELQWRAVARRQASGGRLGA